MAVPMWMAVRRVLRSRAFRALLLRVGPMVASQALQLARQGQWRQLAILHADSLTGGQFSREMLDDGVMHWVVWQDDRPVASYPAYEGALDVALHGHDPSLRRAPQDLPTRRARQSSASRARRASQRLGGLMHRDR